MAEGRTRRFTANVVKRLLGESKPLAEVATELGVSIQRTE